MLIDLSTLSEENIQKLTIDACDGMDIPIMYLQNNGEPNFRWNIDDFVCWLDEDIEQ